MGTGASTLLLSPKFDCTDLLTSRLYLSASIYLAFIYPAIDRRQLKNFFRAFWAKVFLAYFCLVS